MSLWPRGCRKLPTLARARALHRAQARRGKESISMREKKMLSPSIVAGPRRGRSGAVIRGNRDSARNRAENPDGCADRYIQRRIAAEYLRGGCREDFVVYV